MSGSSVQRGPDDANPTAADQLRITHRIAHPRGRSRAFDPAPLLEAVDMIHRANHRPGQLSGGERQRVGIARALVNGPGLLLVDEPTAPLDRRRSQDIVALLARQCHERGIAGVMVTHDHSVLDHCDRVGEMVDGRLSATPVDLVARAGAHHGDAQNRVRPRRPRPVERFRCCLSLDPCPFC